VLIHGSCVSRDTFEFLDPKTFTLTDYVARQSIISAMGPSAAEPRSLALLTSAFQRRMLAGDAASSFRQTLREHAGEVDLLVLDLFDERLGVFEHLDGSFSTDSVELRSLGEQGLPAGALHHRMGSGRHRDLFEAALHELRTDLDALGLRSRTVLLAPRWADHDWEGGEPASSFGANAWAMNPVFDRYVDLAGRLLDVPVLGNKIDARSEPEHRWGSAPFHYDDETYAELAALLSAHSPRRSGSVTAGGGVRVTTLRRRGARPIVTLRQAGPEQIIVTTRSADATAYAFQLYAGTEQVRKVHYRRSPSHVFDVSGLGPGPFHVRAFVKDAAGGRTPVVSERLRLTR
jgi:hypothetical protein